MSFGGVSIDFGLPREPRRVGVNKGRFGIMDEMHDTADMDCQASEDLSENSNQFQTEHRRHTPPIIVWFAKYHRFSCLLFSNLCSVSILLHDHLAMRHNVPDRLRHTFAVKREQESAGTEEPEDSKVKKKGR